MSAYFYNPSGNALGGPQAMPGGHVLFSNSYLAKVTEKVNNVNINGKTITDHRPPEPGHQRADQPNGGDSSTPPRCARLYARCTSRVRRRRQRRSPQGYLGQPGGRTRTAPWST